MVRAASRSLSAAPASPDEDDEAPLDPAVERVRQRLKRLILISSATLLIGIAAVIIAVIYKVGPVRDKPTLASGAAEAVVAGALPSGSRVVGTALDGTLLALTFERSGATGIVVIDLASNKVVRRLSLGEGAPPAAP